jgi:hypothetical protein
MMKEDKERINNYQNKVKDEGMVRNYKIWAKIFYQIDKLVSQILNDMVYSVAKGYFTTPMPKRSIN